MSSKNLPRYRLENILLSESREAKWRMDEFEMFIESEFENEYLSLSVNLLAKDWWHRVLTYTPVKGNRLTPSRPATQSNIAREIKRRRNLSEYSAQSIIHCAIEWEIIERDESEFRLSSDVDPIEQVPPPELYLLLEKIRWIENLGLFTHEDHGDMVLELVPEPLFRNVSPTLSDEVIEEQALLAHLTKVAGISDDQATNLVEKLVSREYCCRESGGKLSLKPGSLEDEMPYSRGYEVKEPIKERPEKKQTTESRI